MHQIFFCLLIKCSFPDSVSGEPCGCFRALLDADGSWCSNINAVKTAKEERNCVYNAYGSWFSFESGYTSSVQALLCGTYAIKACSG
jgi:hypothetical protein